MSTNTLTRAGFRQVAGPTDLATTSAPARLNALGEQLLRKRKSDGAPFLPLQVDKLEAQWAFLVDVIAGAGNGKARWSGSRDAAKYALQTLGQRMRTQGRIHHEEVRHEGRVYQRRRVAFDDIGLPTCECTGGAQHHDVCADDLIDGLRDLMREVIEAEDAEEAHAAAKAAETIGAVLSNHGAPVSPRRLWNDVCPPANTTVAVDEVARIRAWDNRWKVVSENPVDGTVMLERDLYDRFARALNLVAEEEARRQARPLLPPADWTPPKPREGDIDGVDGVTAAQ